MTEAPSVRVPSAAGRWWPCSRGRGRAAPARARRAPPARCGAATARLASPTLSSSSPSPTRLRSLQLSTLDHKTTLG